MILLTGLSFPDILPPQFEGYPLMTIDNDKITLKSEKVDIYWYDTCKIVSDFNLENPLLRNVKLTVGFPIQDPDSMNLEFDRRFRGKGL